MSGYHNTLKQYVIKKIAAENPKLKLFHFGDLDPDGFYILEHLKSGTGNNQLERVLLIIIRVRCT